MAMESLSKVADRDHSLVQPVACDLLSALCALLEAQVSGPVKLAAEDLVGSCLGVSRGAEAAVETLDSMNASAAVKQAATLGMLKKVATRRNK